MAEFLVYNKEHWMDSITQERFNEITANNEHFPDKFIAKYQRGDVVERQPDGFWWNSGSLRRGFGNHAFALVVVTDLADGGEYAVPWERILEYEVVGSNLTIDGHRIRVRSSYVNNISGEGKITRDMVESFLNRWGAIVFTAGDNEVVFDVRILDAIKSTGFWGGWDVLDSLVLTELSYNQGTGVHRIEINYGGVSIPDPYTINRERLIKGLKRRFTNIVHDDVANTITSDTDRATVRELFQEDVKRKLLLLLRRRLYAVNMSTVPFNDIEYPAGSGQFYKVAVVTVGELAPHIINKLTE